VTAGGVEPAIEVRSAAPDDAAALARLRRHWRLERHDIGLDADPTFEDRFEAWYAEELRRGSRVWLAYASGEPIGMLLLFVHERMPEPVRDPGRWGYVGNVYVCSEHRDRGVGRRLLDAALAYADEHAFARVILNPTERSIPFYQRAGFSHDSPLMTRE
jgi:GNAT superfamily N-acetyltransferase